MRFSILEEAESLLEQGSCSKAHQGHRWGPMLNKAASGVFSAFSLTPLVLHAIVYMPIHEGWAQGQVPS